MFIKHKNTKAGLITLADTDYFGLSADDGGKWVLMCEKHSEFIQDTCKKRLWTHANESFAWCESCGEESVEQMFNDKMVKVGA